MFFVNNWEICLLLACVRCHAGTICGTGFHGNIMVVCFLMSLYRLLRATVFLEGMYSHIDRMGSITQVFFWDVF